MGFISGAIANTAGKLVSGAGLQIAKPVTDAITTIITSPYGSKIIEAQKLGYDVLSAFPSGAVDSIQPATWLRIATIKGGIGAALTLIPGSFTFAPQGNIALTLIKHLDLLSGDVYSGAVDFSKLIDVISRTAAFSDLSQSINSVITLGQSIAIDTVDEMISSGFSALAPLQGLQQAWPSAGGAWGQ